MNRDPLDDFVRSAAPPADVTTERVDDLITRVMARLDQQPARPRRRTWLAIGWTLGSPQPRHVLPRYALPIAVAAVLGGLVGAVLPTAKDEQPPLFSLISDTTALQPLGF